MKVMLRFVVLIFLFYPVSGFCNDFKNIYLDLIHKKDFKSLESHLKKWSNYNKNDPELFIAYCNYYMHRNFKTVMVSKKSNDTNSDRCSYEKPLYNIDDVKLGIDYLNKGLSIYPMRLDMHIGKIILLQEIEEYDSQESQILQVIDLIPKYNGKWQWSDGKTELNFKTNFQNDIQQCVNYLMQQNNQTLVIHAQRISQAMMKVFPNNVCWYNDLASTYYNLSDYNNAIKYFKLGEKIDPKDETIKLNIAYCSEKINDKDTALEYFNDLIKSKDKSISIQAKTHIDNLSK